MKFHKKFTKSDYNRSQQYIRNNIKQVNVPLNKVNDADLIEWLEYIVKHTGQTKGGYIKRLIREDMDHYKR